MSKLKKTQNCIPQVVALAKVTSQGKIKLKKTARSYLGFDGGGPLYLESGREYVLSTAKKKGTKEIDVEKNGVLMPIDVLEKLGLEQGDWAALVERGGKLAIKAFAADKREGAEARWTDVETPYKIVRTVEMNPTPEVFLEYLRKRHKSLKLRRNLRTYVKDRNTYEALLLRQVLGAGNPSDERLRSVLIKDRFKKQQKDGSWESSVTNTARNLRELAHLDVKRENRNMRRAADWLLARPESPYNPGLWFVLDELVREQAAVVAKRKRHTGKGTRERFNQTKNSEVNLVRAGDPVINDPCGARIIWTSALALEALLLLGFKNKKRVRSALQTLAINPNWCDNNYQHGLSSWSQTEPVADELLEAARERVIQFYRCGGIVDPAAFTRPERLESYRRVASWSVAKHDTYLLKMALGVGEGCKIIMTKALSYLKTGKLTKMFEIRLWEFGAMLNLGEERIKYLKKDDFTDRAVFFLQIFTRGDFPIAKLSIARMLPWIVKSQNQDGAWGAESAKDATTLAVVNALASLDRYWSSNLLPRE